MTTSVDPTLRPGVSPMVSSKFLQALKLFVQHLRVGCGCACSSARSCPLRRPPPRQGNRSKAAGIFGECLPRERKNQREPAPCTTGRRRLVRRTRGGWFQASIRESFRVETVHNSRGIRGDGHTVPPPAALLGWAGRRFVRRPDAPASYLRDLFFRVIFPSDSASTSHRRNHSGIRRRRGRRRWRSLLAFSREQLRLLGVACSHAMPFEAASSFAISFIISHSSTVMRHIARDRAPCDRR